MDTFVPSVDGHFISERISRIAEIIQDYDPTMELVWIPPENRDGFHKPFAVRHNPLDAAPYIAFFLDEDEVDHRVIARIWENDTRKNDVKTHLENMERAAELVRLKERMDKEEERKDFVTSVISSPLHTYRHNGKVYR